LFVDAAQAAGLREPGLKMLGFGTQFLDADLDGWLDLVVVNGHVDDETYRGIPYRMPAQFFRNTGGGRFVKLPAESLGPWFHEKHLGRGLARCDWNRDGREDFVVVHLDTPAALLTNQTPNTANFVALQLRGVRSNRDAIGAQVKLTSGDRTWVRQLSAGDGYQASNERQLLFGLGDRNVIDELTIEWPSGLEQRFAELPVNKQLLLIEGRLNPVVLTISH
jgi:hypothetical protein